MREGHLYKCGSLKPWRSNPHEKGHPTGLLALVKHQAFPWLTWGANPLSLDLSLFSQFSYTDAVILLVCKSNLDILRKDKLSLRGFFLYVYSVQCIVTCVSGGRVCTQDTCWQCWQFSAFGPRLRPCTHF